MSKLLQGKKSGKMMEIPFQFNLPSTGRFLLAFSGGSDSLALMLLLSSIAPERTMALYINHKIRDNNELEREIALNRHNANVLNIPLEIVELDENSVFTYAKEKKCGVEASARALRYQKLFSYAYEHSFDYILTAHHREDQIETVLMRILENSPFYTYHGIAYSEGKILRPLLDVSKNELLKIVKASKLEYSTDSTNSDIKYKRNMIRHVIMPELRNEEKLCIINISKNVASLRKKEKDIEVKLSHVSSINRNSFLLSMPDQCEKAIFKCSEYFSNPERLSRAFLDDVYHLARKAQGRKETGYLDFIFTKSEIRIFRKCEYFEERYTPDLKRIGPFEISHEIADSKTLLIDHSKLNGSVVIRKSKIDDSIKLKEGTKKVRELEKRAHVPYSVVMEDNSGVVAVFLRQFSALDRLAVRFYSSTGTPIALI